MNRAQGDAWALRGTFAFVALFCAGGLYRVLAVLFLRVPFDPNEGWNAYHAAAAMSGAPLYPGPNTLFFNNYPPLSFYLVGALGALLGDNIVAGRVFSLLGFAAACLFIVAIARRAKLGFVPAFGGGLFFASVLLLFSDYVGMDDPQMLGHALQLAGLYLLLREPRRPEVIVLTALIFACSLFVKHNLIVLPLATVAWLVIVDRIDALILAVASVVSGAIGLIWFRLSVGTGLFVHLASPRLWSTLNMGAGLSGALAWAAVPLLAIGYLLYAERSDRLVRFCAIYVGFALVIGAIASGGAGVDANAFFDLAIALSLSIGLMLGRIGSRGRPVAPPAVLAFVPIAFSLYTALDADWYTRDFWLHPWVDEARTAEADIALLRTNKGNALCETLALCYWAGKAETVDVFNLGQAYATGARSDRALIEKIEHQDFAAIEYESISPFSLTPAVLAATRRAYELRRSSDDGLLFLPRR